MACCSEYQTECLRVVTIGYIKSFIGSEIQNSNNGNPMTISRTDDTYCPTYSELTGGTIIQTWSQDSSTPRYDRDGIVVNETCTGTGQRYADNQLVNQKDFSMKYTRFNNLSISSSKTSGLSPCGESTTITTTYNYTRYTKSMNDSCAVPTPASSSSNGACADLSWHAEIGSVSNCNSYTIGKNGYKEAPARCDHVSATTTFRSASKASNKIEICQNALTGGYDYYTGNSRKEMTGLTATYTTPTTIYGCNINQSVSMVGTGYYRIWREYAWIDNCNTVYDDKIERVYLDGQTEGAGSDSYTFNFNVDCCEGGYNESKTLRVSYGSYSSAVTYNAICSSCADDPSQCGEPPCCKIIGYNAGYCSGYLDFEVKDCGYPDPDDPKCKCAIVDGNHEKYQPATGFYTDDSSHVNDEARFAVEIYKNATDAEMNINHSTDLPSRDPDEVLFSSGRTGTVGPVTITFSDCGTSSWDHSQCVAAKLQYKAGVTNTQPACSGHSCDWGCYGSSQDCDYECYHGNEYVQGDPYLCTGRYTIGSNVGTGHGNRVIAVWWYPYDGGQGQANYRMCQSRVNLFSQYGS